MHSTVGAHKTHSSFTPLMMFMPASREAQVLYSLSAVCKYTGMPSLTYRAHGFVCSVHLSEIPEPGDTAYVKNKLRQDAQGDSPVRWLGFICKTGSRALSWAKPGKIVAKAVTNTNIVSGQWRELSDDEYVAAMIVQVDDSTFGAFAIVENDGWPVVKSESKPLLTVVREKKTAKVIPLNHT